MIIALSMRIDENDSYQEMRDTIDQRWYAFAKSCGFTVLLLPNNVEMVQDLLKAIPVDGVILSGGNELSDPKTLQRDHVEAFIFEYAIKYKKPIIGVCRGMQALAVYFGSQLIPIDGHVGSHELFFNGEVKQKNSYHNNGFLEVNESFNVLGYTKENYCIESICHKELPFYGIMWHPERYTIPEIDDIKFFKKIFRG